MTDDILIFHTVAAVNKQKHPNPNQLVYGYKNVNDQAIFSRNLLSPKYHPQQKKTDEHTIQTA